MKKCAEHLQDVMRNEQRENETAQQKALEKYSELDNAILSSFWNFKRCI